MALSAGIATITTLRLVRIAVGAVGGTSARFAIRNNAAECQVNYQLGTTQVAMLDRQPTSTGYTLRTS